MKKQLIAIMLMFAFAFPFTSQAEPSVMPTYIAEQDHGTKIMVAAEAINRGKETAALRNHNFEYPASGAVAALVIASSKCASCHESKASVPNANASGAHGGGAIGIIRS